MGNKDRVEIPSKKLKHHYFRGLKADSGEEETQSKLAVKIRSREENGFPSVSNFSSAACHR